MTDRKPIDRVLRIALVLFVAMAVGFLVRHVVLLHQREQEITKLALQRTQQMLQLRLDAMFHEWSEDLQEEAAAVEAADSATALKSWQRWIPLIDSHWAILSVRLADERGNETAIYRNDTLLDLVTTTEGSKNGVPIAVRVDHSGSLDTVHVPWTSHQGYDPRERIWFSKALENDREEPVWSLRQFGDSSESVLQVSYMIRGGGADEPFRVLLFDVDMARSEAMDPRSSTAETQGTLLLTANGSPLFSPAADRHAELREACDVLRTLWLTDQLKRYFSLTMRGRSFAGMVEPFRLNGLVLHSGIVLDTAPVSAWTAADRRVEWTVGIMLVILILLLAGIWMRDRYRNNALRLQARQTQNQARKLDKVIGEREVLSREVHHRVKNNLQVVSSLLNLQAASLNDGPVREEFLRGKRRIDTIALVHHKLYGLADLRNVDLAVFFAQLIDALASMHRPQSATVSVSVSTAGIKSDQDTAIELGIVLCELVTNAYQHAFPYASGGHVEVIITNVDGDLHRLLVRNNGVALQGVVTTGPGKLGLEIVDALAGQLDGSFHIRAEEGVAFEVLFRMRRPAQTGTLPSEEEEQPE